MKLHDFQPYAQWRLHQGELVFDSPSQDVTCGLFLLLCNDQPMYLGKFENSLRNRLGVLRNPPTDQETHSRLNPKIREALEAKKEVRVAVYELPKEELLSARAQLRSQFHFPWAAR